MSARSNNSRVLGVGVSLCRVAGISRNRLGRVDGWVPDFPWLWRVIARRPGKLPTVITGYG